MAGGLSPGPCVVDQEGPWRSPACEGPAPALLAAADEVTSWHDPGSLAFVSTPWRETLVTFQFYFESERRLNSLEDKHKHNHCLPSCQTHTGDDTPLGFVSDKRPLLSVLAGAGRMLSGRWVTLDYWGNIWAVSPRVSAQRSRPLPSSTPAPAAATPPTQWAPAGQTVGWQQTQKYPLLITTIYSCPTPPTNTFIPPRMVLVVLAVLVEERFVSCCPLEFPPWLFSSPRHRCEAYWVTQLIRLGFRCHDMFIIGGMEGWYPSLLLDIQEQDVASVSSDYIANCIMVLPFLFSTIFSNNIDKIFSFQMLCGFWIDQTLRSHSCSIKISQCKSAVWCL